MLEFIGVAKAAVSTPSLNILNSSGGTTSFSTVVSNVLSWVLILAGAIAVIYLVYAGILYITAGGDAEKATKGRTGVINAVIGIVIILLAILIVRWVDTIVKSGTA